MPYVNKARMHAVDVMLPAAEIPVCAPDTSLADGKMTTSGKRAAAVFEGHKFLGLITLDDIAEVLHVLAAAMQGQGRRAAGGMGQQVGESVQDA